MLLCNRTSSICSDSLGLIVTWCSLVWQCGSTLCKTLPTRLPLASKTLSKLRLSCLVCEWLSVVPYEEMKALVETTPCSWSV